MSCLRLDSTVLLGISFHLLPYLLLDTPVFPFFSVKMNWIAPFKAQLHWSPAAWVPELPTHLTPHKWRLEKMISVIEAFLLPMMLGSTDTGTALLGGGGGGWVGNVVHVPSSELVVTITNKIFKSPVSLPVQRSDRLVDKFWLYVFAWWHYSIPEGLILWWLHYKWSCLQSVLTELLRTQKVGAPEIRLNFTPFQATEIIWNGNCDNTLKKWEAPCKCLILWFLLKIFVF